MADKKGKRQRWRLKVLSTRKQLSADTRRSYLENQTPSTFLSIAPEIRNRIYHYVLGGRNIHSQGESTYACHSSMSDRTAARLATERGPEVGSTIRQADHTQCFGADSGDLKAALSLSLLEVCRQIHSEASLVPFTANTFSLSSHSEIAGKLIPEQRRAITSVIIEARPHRYWNGGLFPQVGFLDRFPGLRHITVLADLRVLRASSRFLLDACSAELDKVAQKLKHINWETAVVCIASDTMKSPSADMVSMADGLREKSREVERVLLEPLDDAAEERRKQEKREKRMLKQEADIELKEEAKQRSNTTRSQRGLRQLRS